KPEPIAPPSRVDPESEWHWYHPEAVENTTPRSKGEPPALYPLVVSERWCKVLVSNKQAFVLCGRDVARIDGPRLDPSEFRRASNVSGIPTEIRGTYPDDFWVTIEPPSSLRSPDPSEGDRFRFSKSTSRRLHAGTWTAHASSEQPVPYASGKLLFML